MNHRKTLSAAALLLATAACSTPTTTPQTIATATAQQPATQAGVGKPSAPVRIEFQPASSAILIGVPMSVTTVLTPSADVDRIEVRYSLSEGLTAVERLPTLLLEAQKAGTELRQTLVFSPLAEGQQYLNVFVTTQRGQQRMTRVAAFPVAVGNSKAKTAAAVQTAPGGERVVSMPATEK